MNCALGAPQMKPFVEELQRLAPVPFSCYPNAGLPNAFGGFDETPERMAKDLHEFAANGWVNIVGGCCGTTPEHITAIAAAVRGPEAARAAAPGAVHAPVGDGAAGAAARHQLRQHRRAHQRHRLPALLEAHPGRPVRGGAVGRAPAGGRRRADHRREPRRGHAGLEGGDDHVPEPGRVRARHRARARDDRQLQLRRDRDGPEVPPGQGHRELDQPEGRRRRLPRARPAGPPLRGRRRGDGVRRGGPGRHRGPQGGDLRPRLPHPHGGAGLPAAGRDLRPERAHGRDRHRGAQRLRGRVHRGHAPDQGGAAGRQGERTASATSRSRSAGTTTCARPCTRRSCTTRSRPASTWASSTRASSRSTRRSRPTCGSWSRTCCSTGGPTRPSGWSRSRTP